MTQIRKHSKSEKLIATLFLLLICSFFQVASAQLLWSDAATWTSFGSTKPTVGQEVTIPNGIHILLDENTPDLGGLIINGKLEFDNQNLNLTADYIMLTGELEIGTVGSPYLYQAVLTLNALNLNQSIMNMGTRGILVMGGTLDLHGDSPTVPWTKINTNASSGSTALTLMETVSWSVGDEIIVGPTDFYQAANGASITQKIDLISVAGVSLSLNTGLNAHRWGQLQYATNSGMSLSSAGLVTPPSSSGFTPTTLDERAPVGNLTRNIIIQASDDALWNNDGFGVHIMVMRMGMGGANQGSAHLDGVEIRRGGQRGNLGRYPFHWHMLSYEGSTTLPDATGQYIRNSSINESMNRGIVIHGTNGVEVSDNVVYNVRGHGIFTEDASERHNVINGNLVLHVRNPDDGYGLKIHETGANADRGSSGFWLSNPDNTVTNNMAGDCNTNGFWLAFPSQTFGLSAGIYMRPDRLRFGVFENNTAHSNRLEGIMIDWAEQDESGDILPQRYVSTSDGQDPVWPYPNQERFTISGLKIWKNGGNGLWDRSHWANNLEIVNADNCFSFFAGSGDYGLIDRCLVVGNSLNHLMNGTDRDDLPYSLPPSAFATYHSTFDMTNNVVLNFPEVAGEASGVFSTVDYYIRGVEKGQVRNSNNLIINSHPGIKLTAIEPQYKLAGALWDPNGNWGGNPGDYLVYDDLFFTYGQTPTTVMPNTAVSGGVLVEGPFYGFDGFIVNEANQPWNSFMEIQVTRLDNGFNPVGTWSVGEGTPGQLLFNMRHFAAHPNSYYELEFPTMGEVTDVAISVTNMINTTDHQVVGIEYTGNNQVDQVYFTTYASHFGFGFPDQPAGQYKQIYQPVANRQAVVDASNGQVYWHDTQNDMVWVKIQGGANQFWNPGDYEPDSDEMIYWHTYIRIMGSEAVLAVDFMDFQAEKIQDEHARLTWEAQTFQSDYFEIERSTDGVNFKKIDKLKSGADNEISIYRYTDKNVSLGMHYYRIKEVGLDGKITYSTIKSLKFTNEHQVKIFPNPVRDVLFLNKDKAFLIQKIEVLNAQSQILLSFENEFNQLNIGELSNGVYYLKIYFENGFEIKKVVKM
jgi:hypothetical protein